MFQYAPFCLAIHLMLKIVLLILFLAILNNVAMNIIYVSCAAICLPLS